MVLKEIVWKSNQQGGETAYIGTVRIGQYFYNGIDSKIGTYIVSSNLPNSMLIRAKIFEIETAQEMITNEFDRFIKNITK